MSPSNSESAMNYEAQFDEMFVKLKANPAQLEEFLKDPQPVLHAAGIPVLNTVQMTPGASNALMANAQAASIANYKIGFVTRWWGVDVIMNEELTQAIVTGSIVGQPLVALITSSLAVAGIVTGPIAAVIAAAFGLAIAMKIAEIKLVDNGKGVHWPITWPQWAGLVAAVPSGPPAVLAAMLVFLHPLRN